MSLEAGSYGYVQVQGQYAGENLGATFVATDTDGYRDDKANEVFAINPARWRF